MIAAMVTTMAMMMNMVVMAMGCVADSLVVDDNCDTVG
jgi:hypothetical protein